MASTTDNFDLPLYDTGDPANLRDQYNSAMGIIDGELKKSVDTTTTAINTATDAKTTANDAVGRLDALGITDNDAAGTSRTRWDGAASLAAKFGNLGIINVKDFGAKGDGETDDTSAIKSAIDHAKQWPGDCAIVIPGGRYIISSTINIEPYMHVRGVGVPVIQYTGATGEAITISWSDSNRNIGKDSYFHNQPWQVSDVLNGIALYGQGSGTGIRIGNTTPVSVDGTNWYNVARSCFNNIDVANFATGIQVTPYNNFLNRFDHIHIEHNDINIAFGGESMPGATNYGECVVISESTIADGNTGFMFYHGGFDVYVDKCGLDFCETVVEEHSDLGNHVISISRCNIEGISYIYQGRESQFTTLLNLYDNIIYFPNNSGNALFKTAPPISYANVHVGNNTIITGGNGQYNDFVDEHCLVDKTGYSVAARRNAYAMISSSFNRVKNGNDVGNASFTSDKPNAQKTDPASELTKYGVTSEIKTTVAVGDHCFLGLNDKFDVTPGEILRATILLKISTESKFSINFSIKWYYNDTQVGNSGTRYFGIDASPDVRYYHSLPIVVPSGVNKASIELGMWPGTTETIYEIGKIIVQ